MRMWLQSFCGYNPAITLLLLTTWSMFQAKILLTIFPRIMDAKLNMINMVNLPLIQQSIVEM